jgi:hypothetical protein
MSRLSSDWDNDDFEPDGFDDIYEPDGFRYIEFADPGGKMIAITTQITTLMMPSAYFANHQAAALGAR